MPPPITLMSFSDKYAGAEENPSVDFDGVYREDCGSCHGDDLILGADDSILTLRSGD